MRNATLNIGFSVAHSKVGDCYIMVMFLNWTHTFDWYVIQ